MMAAMLAQAQRTFYMCVDASVWSRVKAFLRIGQAQRIVFLAAPTPADAATCELRHEPHLCA